MEKYLPVYIGRDAISHLVDYCTSKGLNKFVLVADENTFSALGSCVEQALQAARFNVLSIVLHGKDVIADEHSIVEVLSRVDTENRTFLAVGAGTLTDISRFVSHRTKSSFISLPTAPSVDGFTSIGAPLVVGGLKRTFRCQPPVALFADLTTLTAAPKELVAAGFGDMLGKFLSVADWKLGNILWDEPWDGTIAQELIAAAQSCIDARDQIRERSEKGIHTLMSGLVTSGCGMLAMGHSAPASGGEHHLSHHWEMMLLRAERPAILHGLKVGVASVLTAQRYHALCGLTRDQVAAHMKWSERFRRAEQERTIRRAYGAMADEIISEHQPFLNWTEESYRNLTDRIVDRWGDVQEIGRAVPQPQQLIEWLNRVNGPATANALGLKDAEVGDALEYSHYLRERFTIHKLWFALGFSQRQVTLGLPFSI